MQVKEGKKKVAAAKQEEGKQEDPDEILAMLNDL
jgi:hypothetical protein